MKSKSRRIALAVAFGLFAAIQSVAQNVPEYTARIDWKSYRLGVKKVGIDLPKRPVGDVSENPCDEVRRERYFAYAEHTVYQINIFSKLKMGPGSFCHSSSKFDQRLFDKRLSELGHGQTATLGELVSKGKTLSTISFVAEGTYYRIVKDIEKGIWVELIVTERVPNEAVRRKFIDSFSFESGRSAIEVKQGAERTLGDADSIIDKSELKGIGDADRRVLFRPHASYTRSARGAGVKGTVRLKVTLMHHGGVGKIFIVDGLTHGLNEQAIKAAQRLVFLPQIVDGEPVDSTATVEYGFSIY